MHSACAILSSVACLPLPYFSTLSHKRHDFPGRKLLNTKCVLWFSIQLLSETFLILRRNERDMIKNVVDINVKCLLFLSVLMKQIFSTYFRKKNQISNFRKMRAVRAELFHADTHSHTHYTHTHAHYTRSRTHIHTHALHPHTYTHTRTTRARTHALQAHAHAHTHCRSTHARASTTRARTRTTRTHTRTTCTHTHYTNTHAHYTHTHALHTHAHYTHTHVHTDGNEEATCRFSKYCEKRLKNPHKNCKLTLHLAKCLLTINQIPTSIRFIIPSDLYTVLMCTQK